MVKPQYNYAHKKARRLALAALRDGDPCSRCRKPMFRDQARFLDLDHIDGTAGEYRGLAHRRCNRSHGATKGNRARGRQVVQSPPPEPRWQSRVW